MASSALVGEAAATEQACTVSDNANVRGGPCKSYDILTGRPKAYVEGVFFALGAYL